MDGIHIGSRLSQIRQHSRNTLHRHLAKLERRIMIGTMTLRAMSSANLSPFPDRSPLFKRVLWDNSREKKLGKNHACHTISRCYICKKNSAKVYSRNYVTLLIKTRLTVLFNIFCKVSGREKEREERKKNPHPTTTYSQEHDTKTITLLFHFVDNVTFIRYTI